MAICAVSRQIFRFFSTEMFLEKSSTIHMNFVQIAEFDWLPWQRKGKLSKNNSKFFSSEAIRGVLKLSIHVHNIQDISHYINNVFIVVAHVVSLLWQLSFHRLIMGKVEIGIYFCVTADILTTVLQKCSWSGPLPTK